MKRIGRPALALLVLVLTSIVWTSSAAHAIGDTVSSPHVTPPPGEYARWFAGRDISRIDPDVFDYAVTNDVFDADSERSTPDCRDEDTTGVVYCASLPGMVCNSDVQPTVTGTWMVDHSVSTTYDFRCVYNLPGCSNSGANACRVRTIWWSEIHESGRHWLTFRCNISNPGSNNNEVVESSSATVLYESWFWGNGAPTIDEGVGVWEYSGGAAMAVRCVMPSVPAEAVSCDETYAGSGLLSNRDGLRTGCSAIYSARASDFAGQPRAVILGTSDGGDAFSYTQYSEDTGNTSGACCVAMMRYTDGNNVLSGATGGWPAYYPEHTGTFSGHDGSGVPPGGGCGITALEIEGPDGIPVVDDIDADGIAISYTEAGTYTARMTVGANTSQAGFAWTVNRTGRGGNFPRQAVTEGQVVEWTFELLSTDVPGFVMTSFFLTNNAGEQCSANIATGEPGNGAPEVGLPGEDLAGCVDDFTDGGFWGVIGAALNPANYIRATACVFRWAFIPETGWDAGIARFRADYNGSGVQSLQELWQAPSDAVEQLAAGSGDACGGVDVPLAGQEFAVMDSCTGTGSEIRTVAVTVMRVGIYIAGALACYRIVARGFGVQTSSGGDE